MLRRLSLLLFFAFSALLSVAAPLERGEINGAKFAIALPAHWNHRVLLLAHGYRPTDRLLVADLFPEHLAYRTLVDEGWIVAKTSYRRNGMIIADAIADLDALREHITQTYGPTDRVILEGESMGGMIATLLAERSPSQYTGAIAIGAALQVKEEGAANRLSHIPTIPLLFLTNQSELDGPRAYVTSAAPHVAPNLRPALLRVARDGHVNVNQAERLVALRAVNAWIDSGRAALPVGVDSDPFTDVTVVPHPETSLVHFLPDGRSFETKVTEVSAIYGNVFINTQPADFLTLGIEPGKAFSIEAHGQTYRVVYGRDFNDVPKGEWVAFPNADGFLWLSRNFADAAGTASLSVGDIITITRL